MDMLAARLRAAGVPRETCSSPTPSTRFDFVVGGFSSQILEAALLKFLRS